MDTIYEIHFKEMILWTMERWEWSNVFYSYLFALNIDKCSGWKLSVFKLSQNVEVALNRHYLPFGYMCQVIKFLFGSFKFDCSNDNGYIVKEFHLAISYNQKICLNYLQAYLCVIWSKIRSINSFFNVL